MIEQKTEVKENHMEDNMVCCEWRAINNEGNTSRVRDVLILRANTARTIPYHSRQKRDIADLQNEQIAY
jgi:hypothetical protein